jgi:Tol biopolymer transport system component
MRTLRRLSGGVLYSRSSWAWSPDGRRIAYETRSAPGQVAIRTVGVDGRGDRLLLRRGGGPVWSPDGRHLAFVAPAACT